MARLSEVLNDAPDISERQVENFLGYKRIGWGQHKQIEVGNVVRNQYCAVCKGQRSFVSKGKLSCLVTSSRTVSIDVTVRCSDCETPREAWFLVKCVDDFYTTAPLVQIERYTENRRVSATNQMFATGKIEDLFERADIAYASRLGAGCMVYLRKIFEISTINAAKAVGIETTGPKGGRKPFKNLLQEVDAHRQIIPPEFSENGYRLFGQLSDVIHEESDEADALAKYDPCRKLVFGIVTNIQNKQLMYEAIESLGWNGTGTTGDRNGKKS
jgi:hypothetical protein